MIIVDRLRPGDTFEEEGVVTRFLAERGLIGLGGGRGHNTLGSLLTDYPSGLQDLVASPSSIAVACEGAKEFALALCRGDQAHLFEVLRRKLNRALVCCEVLAVQRLSTGEGFCQIRTDAGEVAKVCDFEGSMNEGDLGWAALSVEVSDGDEFQFAVNAWLREAGAITVPMHGESPAESFVRSRLVRVLINSLEIATVDDGTLATIRDVLLELHAQSAPNLLLLENAEEFTQHLESLLVPEVPGQSLAPTPDRPCDADRPPQRLVKTARDAEELAAEFSRWLGHADARVTPAGADGGIDVVSSTAIAQVKMEGVASGRPLIQALAGIASLEGKAALFFSLAGYTSHALEWADRADVACFEFAFDGSVEARNAIAQGLTTRADRVAGSTGATV